MISVQLAQLQKDHVINLLDSFHFKEKVFSTGINKRIGSQISYDEEKYFFRLKFNYETRKNIHLLESMQQIKDQQLQILDQGQSELLQNLQVQIKIKNCENQQIDHPSIRETLYFHELKDIDKYVTVKPLAKTPLFLQDMHRKKREMTVLDQKNPYGLPLKAPPLIFDVQLGNKVYFKVKSTYESTNIIEVGSLKKIEREGNLETVQSLKIRGMKIPRLVQDILFKDVWTGWLNFNDGQMLRLHKLAYIGGKVMKVNALMQVHETMTMNNENIFEKMLKWD